jgi:hypothetical protein
MPTTNVKLGHNQKFRLDGFVMEGTRDVEVSIDTKQHDVTAWDHSWTSTLPLQTDVTIRTTLYWQREIGRIWSKFNKHPPQKVNLSIDGVISGPFVPVEMQIANPLNGVLAYDVTFKLWNY